MHCQVVHEDTEHLFLLDLPELLEEGDKLWDVDRLAVVSPVDNSATLVDGSDDGCRLHVEPLVVYLYVGTQVGVVCLGDRTASEHNFVYVNDVFLFG